MNRNGGEIYYDNLSKPWDNPYRDLSSWNNHGFTVSNEMDLQVASSKKIQELKERTVDPQAIPCIVPVLGSSELNSTMWQSLWRAFNNSSLSLLIDTLELENKLDSKKFLSMTAEGKRDFKLPYVQTELLINELINLSQSWNNGILKLTEPRTGHKDRATTLQYGNYICDLIANKYARSMQEQDFDFDKWAQVLL